MNELFPAEEETIEEALAKILEERQELRVKEEEVKLREQALREKELIEKELEKLRSKEVRASQVIIIYYIRLLLLLGTMRSF